MAQLLIRDLDQEVVDRLKKRARRNGRSMQSEMKSLLERAARAESMEAVNLAASIRRMLAGREHTDSRKLLAE